MAFDPKNGYTRETWTEYPNVEEASATLSAITGLAPNRSQMITESVIADTGPNVAQQGTNVASGTVPISSGWAASQQAANNFTAGSVGTPGNKFS